MTDVRRDRQGRLLPTGECWCGCGGEMRERGNFFLPGHDKIAESAVILVKYGSVPEFLVKKGFGPGGRNPRAELERWRRAGGRTR
jgi:hypothetical protein